MTGWKEAEWKGSQEETLQGGDLGRGHKPQGQDGEPGRVWPLAEAGGRAPLQGPEAAAPKGDGGATKVGEGWAGGPNGLTLLPGTSPLAARISSCCVGQRQSQEAI